jgi:hypothetical protein
MEDDCGLEKQAGGEILGQDPALAELAGRLVEAYVPERVYLFGSKARGDAGPDSDYDLMVIVPDDAPAERRRSRLALWVQCLQLSCGRGGCSMPGDASVVGETKAAKDLGAATYGLRRRAGRCLN